MLRIASLIILFLSHTSVALALSTPAAIATSPGMTTGDTGNPALLNQATSLSSPPPIENSTQLSANNTDYSANLESEVFGAHLFTGAFVRQGTSQFNPDYAISLGDLIQVRLWGAFQYEDNLTVDPRGNIFLPDVGPVKVLGVRNRELEKVVRKKLRKVFRKNVNSYASLVSAQPVRVYVSGSVRRPGLYNGSSMDSLLHYLDQAGGIDPERGSFLDIQVKRGDMLRATINLYDFLLNGNMPLIQLASGDVLFVTNRKNTVKVSGLVENAKQFEFDDADRRVADIIAMAKPLAKTTHVRIVRNSGSMKNVEYYSLEQSAEVSLQNGDEVIFTADKKQGTITVRVEGEHNSAQEYVLPHATRLGELLDKISFSENSDINSLQLFRESVKVRQKVMLHASLRSLESAALTARSGTSDEARLRKEEAELILQWIDRAKSIEPAGRVVISDREHRVDLLLENGDVIKVPSHSGLVLISGEVLFPTAVTFDSGKSIDGYINLAGGYTQNADSSRLILSHRDGSFSDITGGADFSDEFSGYDGVTINNSSIRAGDEILVLPKIDVKSRQIAKDLTQILYQIAISARVIIGL